MHSHCLCPIFHPGYQGWAGRAGRKHLGTRGAPSGRTGATAVWRVCLQTMGFVLARAPLWLVRPGRSVAPGSLGSPSPAAEGSGWGVAPRIGHTQGARPPGAATGGGGGCGSRGRGLRPSNSRLLAPRALGGRGGRTWRRGVGGAVTAEGRRGPRVRGCGSAGVSPGCVCSCLAPEFVSLHRDVGVCHPEGCLRESFARVSAGWGAPVRVRVWVATPLTRVVCVCF